MWTKLRPLSLGGARYRETRLGPGPLDEARAVEADAGRFAAPHVGHADLVSSPRRGPPDPGRNRLACRDQRSATAAWMASMTWLAARLATDGGRGGDGRLFAGGVAAPCAAATPTLIS